MNMLMNYMRRNIDALISKGLRPCNNSGFIVLRNIDALISKGLRPPVMFL